MRRFGTVVMLYVVACLAAAGIIVLRGDGPHPRIIALYPHEGDSYWPGGTAQITFSQAMNESSVERGLQVSPGSEGQGAWYGNTLNLQPVGDWQPGVTYHVRLVGAVTDSEGRPLRTPVSFWFRVHHITRLTYCSVGGVRNVCEPIGSYRRPLTHSRTPILSYALSSDGTELAFTRHDVSGLPHLFVEDVDGLAVHQLTRGTHWADSHPQWSPGDTTITYSRQPAHPAGTGYRLGPRRLWNVEEDGSENAPLS